MGAVFIKPQVIWMKGHPIYNELWLKSRLIEDPALLGLGEEVAIKDTERLQPHAGRLDLLMQDGESKRRYEVELQLGATDESHIIRTIEYWDIERKRYPQYDHCAVIVAEDITSRFLNVLSLFNGHIPLIAIQARLFQVQENITVVCTKVLDELTLGLVDEDEEITVQADRSSWESKVGRASIQLADNVLQLVNHIAPGHRLNYAKSYIGLAKNDAPNNFIILQPTKKGLLLRVRLDKNDQLDQQVSSSGMDSLDYDVNFGRYRLRVDADDLKSHDEFLKNLFKMAYER